MYGYFLLFSGRVTIFLSIHDVAQSVGKVCPLHRSQHVDLNPYFISEFSEALLLFCIIFVYCFANVVQFLFHKTVIFCYIACAPAVAEQKITPFCMQVQEMQQNHLIHTYSYKKSVPHKSDQISENRG